MFSSSKSANFSENHQVNLSPKDFLSAYNKDVYEINMPLFCQKLKLLTNINWSFAGVHLNSAKCLAFGLHDFMNHRRYANAVINLLISRGILSGEYNDTDNKLDHKKYRWKCKVTDPVALLTLDADKFREEIDEAQKLIESITRHFCKFLELFPMPMDGGYFSILEIIGCITAKDYYLYNVPIVNFDIEKLRLLKNEAIDIQEMWKRYAAADKTQPLFNQICKKAKPDPAATMSQETHSIATSAFALLSNKADNSNPSIVAETNRPSV